MHKLRLQIIIKFFENQQTTKFWDFSNFFNGYFIGLYFYILKSFLNFLEICRPWNEILDIAWCEANLYMPLPKGYTKKILFLFKKFNLLC